MSIRTTIDELDQIKSEISRNNSRNKFLRGRKKVLEETISSYLQNKNQTGVKYKGKSIILESIEKRKIKKKSVKERDAIAFFEDLGVSNPSDTYQRLLEVQRGEVIPQNRLRIKNIGKKSKF